MFYDDDDEGRAAPILPAETEPMPGILCKVIHHGAQIASQKSRVCIAANWNFHGDLAVGW
jgi:hypothetical protein